MKEDVEMLPVGCPHCNWSGHVPRPSQRGRLVENRSRSEADGEVRTEVSDGRGGSGQISQPLCPDCGRTLPFPLDPAIIKGVMMLVLIGIPASILLMLLL